MIEEADYVIAGAGSAGCVLASRLSENPAHKIILLEAGGNSDRFLVKMPVGSYVMLGKPETDWLYVTEPDPSLNYRKMIWSAGRMLGGGSAINGMVYIRGSRADYDGWARHEGCTGWSWDEVRPYFMKSEGFAGAPSRSHAVSGELGVSMPRSQHRLTKVFIEACKESGLRGITDYCDGDIDGAFANYVTQRGGQRASAARAFLEAAMQRPNLKVTTGALVDKVLIENGRATGVQYLQSGETRIVHARREVIVTASTMQSPAILLRSGIGPAAALRGLGIEMQVDAPEVGQNLQEHASFQTSYFVNIPTYNTMLGRLQMAKNLFDYLVFRRGMFTAVPVEAMAFLRSLPDLVEPDIKLQFGAVAFDPEKRAPHKRAGVVVFANVAKPRSRGEIRLRSTNPADRPIIDHRLLGDPDDVAALIRGLKKVGEIFDAPAFSKYLEGRLTPALPPVNDAQ
jgi:choline dehydrogenase